MKHTRLTAALATVFATLAAGPLAHAQNLERHFLGFKQAATGFEIATSDGRYLIKPYAPNIVETSFVPSNRASCSSRRTRWCCSPARCRCR